MEAKATGQMPPSPLPSSSGDVRFGFVYQRVPHVTQKSIANNADIHEGASRGEVDAVIAGHAETEVLFDKPYIDPKTVRVTGPFTIEKSLPTPGTGRRSVCVYDGR